MLQDKLVGTGSGTENKSNNTSESGSGIEETTGFRRPLKNPKLWKQIIRKRNKEDKCTS